MTEREQAMVEEIIRSINAMDTVPSIELAVCRAFPEASEAKLSLLVEVVYDGIEYP